MTSKAKVLSRPKQHSALSTQHFMSLPLIQSAINFSEGRRPQVVEAIVGAALDASDAVVADFSSDIDHNRMVATLLGEPEAVRQAALAMARIAVAQIDMRTHHGAHPRMGAVDVVPIVPIRGITMDECVALSRQIGHDLAADLGLPVYLYEQSAAPGRRTALPDVRKGGFEGLFTEPMSGIRAPDFGPDSPHPTAGAVVVGARMSLVAYNVDLDTPDVAVARRVAGAIRQERETCPALTGVRALGLWLPSRRRAQVSMNLTQPLNTPLPAVFDWVWEEARRHAANIYESEIIGLIPRHSLGGEPPERILWRGFRETQILDDWLARL